MLQDRCSTTIPRGGKSLHVWRARGVVTFCAFVLLCCPRPAAAGNNWFWSGWQPVQTPHPAVVRVVAREPDGMSLGSGTLVDRRDQYGLVLTAWHVVADAPQQVTVIFPDGFRSAAKVLAADRDWDLAALMIWRPSVSPVPLASRAPMQGERLIIAGYGAGRYRQVSGRCTQYLAPSDHDPYELVELGAAARQGDSGGPIFNAQGHLAGVLFGSVGTTTTGSCVVRVRRFLATCWPVRLPAVDQSHVGSEPIARGMHKDARASARPILGQLQQRSAGRPVVAGGSGRPNHDAAEAQQLVPLPWRVSHDSPPQDADGTPRRVVSRADASACSDHSGTTQTIGDWDTLAGSTNTERLKTLLALVGMAAIIGRLRRWFSRSSGPDEQEAD